jgi:hypothetical protein
VPFSLFEHHFDDEKEQEDYRCGADKLQVDLVVNVDIDTRS